jgi:hypothetical protein
MPTTSKAKIFTIITCALFLSACGSKKTSAPSPTPTPEPKLIELDNSQKPYISLIPRQDGHELKMVISKIPQNVSQIEYELLYNATDNGLEIEKGVGDTIKLDKQAAKIERDLLLGTSSCTNGCKYKYDNGVTGGTLSLNFYTSTGQVFTFESPFTLKSAVEFKKNKSFALASDEISITASPSSSNDFFVLLKNFGAPDNTSQFSSIYSVFSSGSGIAKIQSIQPATLIKDDQSSLVGDYLAP